MQFEANGGGIGVVDEANNNGESSQQPPLAVRALVGLVNFVGAAVGSLLYNNDATASDIGTSLAAAAATRLPTTKPTLRPTTFRPSFVPTLSPTFSQLPTSMPSSYPSSWPSAHPSRVHLSAGQIEYQTAYTTQSLYVCIYVNIVAFVVLLIVFELNKSTNQIYLKRCIKRFEDAGRVPRKPDMSTLGWLSMLLKIKETDVLNMVGLDAYMLMRYITMCIKLSLFLAFFGCVALAPIYATTPNNSDATWNSYTIFNVTQGSYTNRQRLWAAAIFSYVFAGYFCHLIYNEYSHFTVRRLQYLTKTQEEIIAPPNLDDPNCPIKIDEQGRFYNSDIANRALVDSKDPDTPQQKYYTVMVENIPEHLRSAENLYMFFDRLFKDDIYSVEVALDLSKLNSLCSKRKAYQHHLEKAIAYYEATDGERPKVYVHNDKANIFDTYRHIDEKATPEEKEKKKNRHKTSADRMNEAEKLLDVLEEEEAEGLLETLKKYIVPELFGFEPVDAIHYYTERLTEINAKVTELQQHTFRKPDDDDNDDDDDVGDVQNAGKKMRSSSNCTNSPRAKREAKSKSALPKYDTRVSQLVGVTSSFLGDWWMNFSVESFVLGPRHNDGITLYEKKRNIAMGLPPHTKGFKSISDYDDVDDVVDDNRDIVTDESQGDNSDLANGGGGNNTTSSYDKAKAKSNHMLKSYSRDSFDSRKSYVHQDSIMPFYNNSNSNSSSNSDSSNNSNSKINSSSYSSSYSSSNSNNGADIHKTVERSPRRKSVNFMLDDDANGKDSSSSSSFSLATAVATQIEREKELFEVENKGVAVEDIVANPLRDDGQSSAAVADNVDVSSVLVTSPPEDTFSPLSTSNPNPSDKKSNNSSENISNINSSSLRLPTGVGLGLGLGPNPNPRPFKSIMKSSSTTASSTSTSANLLGSDKLRAIAKHVGNTASTVQKLTTSILTTAAGNVSSNVVQLKNTEGNMFASAFQGIVEVEKAFEMLTLGSLSNYSSTAFITMKSRLNQSIATQQMLLSQSVHTPASSSSLSKTDTKHFNTNVDSSEMSITHAPSPNDIVWDNIYIPKKQIELRTFITNIIVIIGSIFWSSLVNWANAIAGSQNMGAVVMLSLLLGLPFVFDYLARYYQGLKTETEIQNSIMSRYYFYLLVNIYVTVSFGGFNGTMIYEQIFMILRAPHTLVTILGLSIPTMSLFFCNLVIIKALTAIPLEFIRPWSLSPNLIVKNFLDKKRTTRRDLRQGAFYAWPMLYGWVYPQIEVVVIILMAYACIAPLISVACLLFFILAHFLYKYHLMYVYINNNQGGGIMFYEVVHNSMMSLMFASLCILGYLSLQNEQQLQTYFTGPCLFTMPLPFTIYHFWHILDKKFKRQSVNLSLLFAKECDEQNQDQIKQINDTNERINRLSDAPSTPQQASQLDIPQLFNFSHLLYRQPALSEKPIYPEPYRNNVFVPYRQKSTLTSSSPSSSPSSLSSHSTRSSSSDVGYDSSTPPKDIITAASSSSDVEMALNHGDDVDDNHHYNLQQLQRYSSKFESSLSSSSSSSFMEKRGDALRQTRERRGSLSIDLDKLTDENEVDYSITVSYFHEYVKPLAEAGAPKPEETKLPVPPKKKQHQHQQQSKKKNTQINASTPPSRPLKVSSSSSSGSGEGKRDDDNDSNNENKSDSSNNNDNNGGGSGVGRLYSIDLGSRSASVDLNHYLGQDLGENKA